MALGDKRSIVEYKEDDTKATYNANRSGLRKVRWVSSNEIIFVPESLLAPNRPRIDPRSHEAL